MTTTTQRTTTADPSVRPAVQTSSDPAATETSLDHTSQMMADRARRVRRRQRAVCALNIPAAGAPGAVLVAAPSWGAANLLGLPGLSDASLTLAVPMLGSIWLSIGVVSAVGVWRPKFRRSLAGMFAVQAVYKTVWTISALTSVSTLSGTALGFAIGYTAVIPLLSWTAITLIRSEDGTR